MPNEECKCDPRFTCAYCLNGYMQYNPDKHHEIEQMRADDDGMAQPCMD